MAIFFSVVFKTRLSQESKELAYFLSKDRKEGLGKRRMEAYGQFSTPS